MSEISNVVLLRQSAIRFTIAFLMLVASMNIVFACEVRSEFANTEVTDIIERALSPDPAFNDISRYRQLMCAKRMEVVLHARMKGLESENTVVRSIALHAALFEKESIVIEPIVDETLKPEELDWVRKNRFIAFPVAFRDQESSCLSFSGIPRCDARNGLSINGDTVDISSNASPLAFVGQFSLSEHGDLEGYIVAQRPELDLKARIKLD